MRRAPRSPRSPTHAVTEQANGDTPMHVACRLGNGAIANHLAYARADVHVVNVRASARVCASRRHSRRRSTRQNAGETPLACAERAGHKHVLESTSLLLLNSPATPASVRTHAPARTRRR